MQSMFLNADGPKQQHYSCNLLRSFIQKPHKTVECEATIVVLLKFLVTAGLLTSVAVHFRVPSPFLNLQRTKVNVNLKIVNLTQFKRVLTDVSAMLPSSGYKTK